MPRKVYGDRLMLNLPGHGSTASIVAEIESTEDWQSGRGRGMEKPTKYNTQPNATLSITDCHNRVDLEVDISTENEYNNTLHKIDAMIVALSSLREGVVAERPRYVARAAWIKPDQRWERPQ